MSCRLYVTPDNIERGLQDIRFPSMVKLDCQAASAQSKLEKAVSHLDEFRVNLALAEQATTFSTSGCRDFLIAGAAGYGHIISVGVLKCIVLEFDQEVIYVHCEK